MDRGDHLVAQLTHPKHDDRSFQVDVGRCAEHPTEAAMHPASEDAGDPRCLWNKRRDIAQQWPLGGVIRRTDSGFDYGALGFIESAADGSAEVDRIRRGRPQPGLVPAIRGTKVEDVERVARTQGQLHVDTAEAARKVAVLML